MFYVFIVFVVSILSLTFSWFLFHRTKSYPVKDEKSKKISGLIQQGAVTYLKRQYRGISVFFVTVFFVLFILSFFDLVGKFVPFVFVLGGLFSAFPGYIGMKTATMANIRTLSAVQKSLNEGLKIAFSAGSAIAFTVVGFGLLGISVWFFFLKFWYTSIEIAKSDASMIQNITSNMLTFGMGVASMSLFARVGGGIFTKAADVGADLVGKIEAEIPEDDPRNPAVIADNVGDNVGDIAGMGADLYDSFVSAIISTSALSLSAGFGMKGVVLPMLISSVGTFVSMVGTFFVRTKDGVSQKKLLNSLRYGTWISSGLMALFSFFLVLLFFPENFGFYFSVISGLIAGMVVNFVTEFFTSSTYSPVKKLAKFSETGSGTVIIAGLSLGMMSTVLPCLVIGATVLISFFACGGRFDAISSFSKGLYGVGISAVGMLSTLGITLATDAYGPIADNAGGIAEMAGLDSSVRSKTDILDSIGNTTAASGKGFAICSAALTSVALISAYIAEARAQLPGIRLNLNVTSLPVLVGLLMGAMVPFLFSAYTMNAVGKAAMSIVHEVRRQFKSISGLMEGKAEPDYSLCIDICTRDSIRLMVPPAIISIVTPIVVGVILGIPGVTGFLAGITVCAFVLSTMMSNSGGAWDNAKKFIEAGNFGGKGSDSHKSSVVGDTVGDPFKDTSGPSLNVLMKLAAMAAIVFIGIALAFHLL